MYNYVWNPVSLIENNRSIEKNNIGKGYGNKRIE